MASKKFRIYNPVIILVIASVFAVWTLNICVRFSLGTVSLGLVVQMGVLNTILVVITTLLRNATPHRLHTIALALYAVSTGLCIGALLFNIWL